MSLAEIEHPELNVVDWQVVQIALRDANSRACSIPDNRHPIVSRFYRAFCLVTGIEPCRPLADPRLESLRRFLSVSRRNRAIAERFIPDLLDHGYTRHQVTALAMLEC